MPLIKKIPSSINTESMQKILNKFARKQLRVNNYELTADDTIFYPYYIVSLKGKIKRAFNLPDRQIPLIYIIDGVEGKLYKLAGIPEIISEDYPATRLIPLEISNEEAEKKAEAFALTYLRRAFRSFWVPVVELQKTELVYIPLHIQTVTSNEKKYKLTVNGFTGEINIDQKGLGICRRNIYK
ncbi:MAG: hypothetical protein GXW85_04265 [Clostridia bacterium]|nr:hypothetical protein [Clostridia bacterium]